MSVHVFLLVGKNRHTPKQFKKLFSYCCHYSEHLSLGFLYFPFLCLYHQIGSQSMTVALLFILGFLITFTLWSVITLLRVVWL